MLVQVFEIFPNIMQHFHYNWWKNNVAKIRYWLSSTQLSCNPKVPNLKLLQVRNYICHLIHSLRMQNSVVSPVPKTSNNKKNILYLLSTSQLWTHYVGYKCEWNVAVKCRDANCRIVGCLMLNLIHLFYSNEHR